MFNNPEQLTARCDFCDETFVLRAPHQRFDSYDCRVRWQHQQRRLAREAKQAEAAALLLDGAQ